MKKLSEDTVVALQQALSHDLSEGEREKILEIVNKSLAKSVDQAMQAHRDAAVVCCGPEADLAHKIDEEMRLANKMLVANLMGMR